MKYAIPLSILSLFCLFYASTANATISFSFKNNTKETISVWMEGGTRSSESHDLTPNQELQNAYTTSNWLSADPHKWTVYVYTQGGDTQLGTNTYTLKSKTKSVLITIGGTINIKEDENKLTYTWTEKS